MADELKPCPFCGEHCASLMIDQGDKWAHYEPGCLEVRTGYNLAEDAPWRAKAIAAWNQRAEPAAAPGDEAMQVWREAVYAYGGLSVEGAEGEVFAAAIIQRLIDQRDAARTALFNGGDKFYAEGFRAGLAEAQRSSGLGWDAEPVKAAIRSLSIKDANDE